MISMWPHHQIGQRTRAVDIAGSTDAASEPAAEPVVSDAPKHSRTSVGVFDGLGSTLGKVGSALNPVNWFAGANKTEETSCEPPEAEAMAAAPSGVRVVFDPARVRIIMYCRERSMSFSGQFFARTICSLAG
jgi:hypothetical protein